MATSETSSETKISEEKIEKKSPTRWRARRFMLELNQLELYPQLKKNLLSRKTFKYMIVGKETGDGGKEHYHIYVEFSLQTILTKKTVCNCHVDIPKTKAQAHDYCTKDCDIVVEKHPEWIMAWKYSSIDYTGSASTTGVQTMQFSSRLKRNLNSGDKIYMFTILTTNVEEQHITKVRTGGLCQFWTCAN